MAPGILLRSTYLLTYCRRQVWEKARRKAWLKDRVTGSTVHSTESVTYSTTRRAVSVAASVTTLTEEHLSVVRTVGRTTQLVDSGSSPAANSRTWRSPTTRRVQVCWSQLP